VSIGVAGFPKDGTDANELIHQADLAVYRAKLQGRNRVLGASSEPLLMPAERQTRLAAVPEDGDHHAPLPAAQQVQVKEERRSDPHPRPHAVHGPRFLALSLRLGLVVGTVSAVGVSAGIAGIVLTWTSKDLLGLLTIIALIGVGQALALAGLGLGAGAVYFAVNMGLLSVALALEGHERWWAVFRERFAWLLPHYLVYGFIGGVMALAYEAVKLFALGVFAVPLVLMRKTQEAYLKHTQRSAQKLRQAAETIQTQNVSLELANKLLKERSTAAMESLSATVDARDSYTAG